MNCPALCFQQHPHFPPHHSISHPDRVCVPTLFPPAQAGFVESMSPEQHRVGAGRLLREVAQAIGDRFGGGSGPSSSTAGYSRETNVKVLIALCGALSTCCDVPLVLVGWNAL